MKNCDCKGSYFFRIQSKKGLLFEKPTDKDFENLEVSKVILFESKCGMLRPF